MKPSHSALVTVPVGERVRMEDDVVARPLAIEGEAAAVMADLRQPLASLEPLNGGRQGSGSRALASP